MPIRQYVYFCLYSELTPAAEITTWLGIDPDAVTLRGSRLKDPAVPVNHAWKLECRQPGLTVDEQISRVLTRIHPHLDKIIEATRRLNAEIPKGGAVLQVVRYFNEPDEQPGPYDSSASTTANLFGWHLEHDVLGFLTQTGAALDIDEYDLSDG